MLSWPFTTNCFHLLTFAEPSIPEVCQNQFLYPSSAYIFPDALGRPVLSLWTSVPHISNSLSQCSETVPSRKARYPLDDSFGCFRADISVYFRVRRNLYLSLSMSKSIWGSRGPDPLILNHRALDGSERSASRSGHFTPKKRVNGTHWTWGWTQRRKRKFLTLSGNRNTISELSRVSSSSEEYKLHCCGCGCIISFSVDNILTRFANLEYTEQIPGTLVVQ